MTVADWPKIIIDDHGDEVFVDVVAGRVHVDTAAANGLIILTPLGCAEFEGVVAEAREAAGLPGEPVG